MTWAEFLIREHSYNRIEKSEWYKVREIAYASLIGSHVDPKKLPKSKDKFMPLDSEVSKGVSKLALEAIKNAQLNYSNNK